MTLHRVRNPQTACSRVRSSLLTQIILLAVALGIGQWLEKRKVDWLGDAGVALLLGIGMGTLSRLFTFSATYVAWMGFQVSMHPDI